MHDSQDFFSGPGIVRALMRERDWRNSPLGMPDTWPATLRTVVNLILDSRFPMYVAWGPDLCLIYNDAYAEVLAAKHPSALAQPFWEIWPEVAVEIGPVIDGALAGETVHIENQPLTVLRHGVPEQTWFSFSVSPLRGEDGAVAGVYCVCTEITRTVLQERSRAEENARLHRLFEQAPGFMAVLRGPDHVYDLANSAFLALAGRQEVVGKRVRDVHPELQSQGFFELLDQVFQTGQRYVGRAVPFAPKASASGESVERFVDFVYQPIVEDAKVVGIFVQGSDVTDAIKAGAALKASEARLHLALEAGAMGAWHWDIQTGENDWLFGMAEVHGQPAGSTIGGMDGYAKLIHPDDRERVMQVVADALKQKKNHRIEYRVIWPDGRTHWIEGRGQLVVDSAGNPQQMAGVCTDITRRKTSERDNRFLTEASVELARLVDYQETMDRLARLAVPAFADWCSVDMLEDVDTLRRVAVAHVDPEKVALGHELHRRFPPDPELPHGIWKVVRSGKADMVSEITDAMLADSLKDPERLEAVRRLGLRSYIGVPLKTKNKILGVVTFVSAESGRLYGEEDLALAEDLALRAAIAIENASLYREVQEADRRKDVFLATLSHELRNPLAPISNALSLMKLAPGDQAKVERSTRMMERQVGQLARLVDDLMDVSRISAGKMELRKETVSLSAVLHSAVETSRPHIEAAHHQLILTLPGTPMDVHGDHVRLSQAFSNLLNNAAKYTSPGGRIELSAECDSAELTIRVKDNGIGIPREMLKKIFTMFAQDRQPVEYSQGGLGIGLSLVEGVVALHGGTVSAISTGRGYGSEFVVRLPRLATVENAGACGPDVGAGQAEAGRRILVVDDNVDAAKAMGELLELLGHRVTLAHDGLGAIATAREIRPELVLLDIGLPDIDGYETARRIRAHRETCNVHLIALTGWGQEDDKRQSAEAGFDRHWVKPVGLEQLQELQEFSTLQQRDANIV